VNVTDEHAWLLLLGWLVAALRARGPFPLLTLNGEQGACKSTLGKILQSLTDPSAAELRNNLSHVPQWLSDALCRLATGGGFGTRQLYTDDEEVLFSATRPVLLTSITDVVVAGDLLDRAVCLELGQIPEEKRRTEQELWDAFEAVRPRLLGALLDTVSAGLRTLPHVRLDRLPRMADFAVWAEAALRGIGYRPGAFLAAYEANRADVNTTALESVPVAGVLL
jgi:hypothetical protein